MTHLHHDSPLYALIRMGFAHKVDTVACRHVFTRGCTEIVVTYPEDCMEEVNNDVVLDGELVYQGPSFEDGVHAALERIALKGPTLCSGATS